VDRITICQKLIAITRQRIADVLTCQLDDLPELPLGRAINLLILIRGEALTIGEYGATVSKKLRIVVSTVVGSQKYKGEL
jgi:hypothetical protein